LESIGIQVRDNDGEEKVLFVAGYKMNSNISVVLEGSRIYV